MRVIETREVPLAEILVGDYEVRSAEEDLELPALAESIRRDGLLQALGVVETEAGYRLVHGHRRYSACLMARVTPVRCDVIEGDGRALERASMIENYHRRDVSPIERAAQIGHALESQLMTVGELAETFGRSEDWVRRQAAMMAWPIDVVEAVHRRELSVAAAEHLAEIEDDVYRVFLIRQAVDGGCTERTAIAWLAGWRAQVPATALPASVPAEPGGGPKVVMPRCVCLGCRAECPPDGLGMAYLCPHCLVALQTGGRVTSMSV